MGGSRGTLRVQGEKYFANLSPISIPQGPLAHLQKQFEDRMAANITTAD